MFLRMATTRRQTPTLSVYRPGGGTSPTRDLPQGAPPPDRSLGANRRGWPATLPPIDGDRCRPFAVMGVLRRNTLRARLAQCAGSRVPAGRTPRLPIQMPARYGGKTAAAVARSYRRPCPRADADPNGDPRWNFASAWPGRVWTLAAGLDPVRAPRPLAGLFDANHAARSPARERIASFGRNVAAI